MSKEEAKILMSAMSVVADLKSTLLRSHSMHNSLVKLIENLDTENIPGRSNKVLVDFDFVEEIASVASELCDQDQQLLASCRQLEVAVVKTANLDFGSLRQDLKSLTQEVTASKLYLAKKAERISTVINDFRQRCRDEFIQHLREMDLELRKAIKPLVPNKVLEDNIKYRPINSNPSLLNSMESTIKSNAEVRNSQEEEKTEEEQEGKHMQMLVATLENVAKDMINMIFSIDHKYYELVDPAELNSAPPTPLAAPLPEYFSFNFETDRQETTTMRENDQTFTLSEDSKKKILAKLVEFQRDPERLAKRLSSNSLVLIKRLLRKVKPGQLPTEVDISKLLEDRFLGVVDKEDLVFDLINSDTFEASTISKSSETISVTSDENKFQKKLELQEKSRQLRKQSHQINDRRDADRVASVYDKRYSLPENRHVSKSRLKSEANTSEMSPKPDSYEMKLKSAKKSIMAYNSELRAAPSYDEEASMETPVSVKRRMSPLSEQYHLSHIYRKAIRNISPDQDPMLSRNSNLNKAYSASKISSRQSREIRVRSVTPVFGQEKKLKKHKTPPSRQQRKKAPILI